MTLPTVPDPNNVVNGQPVLTQPRYRGVGGSPATDTDLSDNPKVAEFDYTVAANGQRTAMTERFWIDDDATADVVNNYSWTYDGLNRLTDEVFTTNLDDVLDGVTRAITLGLATPSSLTGANRPAKDYHDHYTFDLTGNRLQKSTDLGNDGSLDESIDSTYDANDRLLTESNLHDIPPVGPAPVTTTVYGYDHTQQTDKTVYNGADLNDSTEITSSMHFAYNL